MKIVIIGAGPVGVPLACSLLEEGNDITLIDENAERLQNIKNTFDIHIVVGRGSHPEVLRQADAEDADMLIALTEVDEINIIACRVAHTIFHVPTKIALVRTRAYLEERDKLFGSGTIPIDVLFNPDQIISGQISGLVKHPGALQLVEFGHHQFVLACVVVRDGGSLLQRPLHELQSMFDDGTRIVAVYRNDEAILPDGHTQIYPGDEVFFFAPHHRLDEIIAGLGKRTGACKSVIIAGGGRVGWHLAELLQHEHSVKIIEQNLERANLLAGQLDRVVVLHGDVTDESILHAENVAQADMFCAVTNDEEDNILSALMAKHSGVRKVLALVNRNSYIDLIRRDRIDIDIALSANQIALSQLLHHVRRGDTIAAYSLRRGDAEALEIIAHGDAKSSRLSGHPLGKLRLPKGCSVCAVIRNQVAIPVAPDVVIESGDHVVFFISDRKKIHEVEKLFQLNATFL